MKLKKILLTTVLFSAIFCLFCGMKVFAEKVGGEIKGPDGSTYYIWEVDTETETLTAERITTLWAVADESVWQEYLDSVHHIVFTNTSFPMKNIGQTEDISLISRAEGPHA